LKASHRRSLLFDEMITTIGSVVNSSPTIVRWRKGIGGGREVGVSSWGHEYREKVSEKEWGAE
jgi:hypothetical protein